MTFRLDIGIDPGATGAVGVVADGCFESVADLPQRERKAGGGELDGRQLAKIVREILARHPGASVMVAREHVQPMPSLPDGQGKRRSMGASSAFYYGIGIGRIDGVIETLGLPLLLVHASRWKKAFDLAGREKDYSRTEAMSRLPESVSYLQRKKDHGRADALLIASWLYRSEQLPPTQSERQPDLLEATS